MNAVAVGVLGVAVLASPAGVVAEARTRRLLVTGVTRARDGVTVDQAVPAYAAVVAAVLAAAVGGGWYALAVAAAVGAVAWWARPRLREVLVRARGSAAAEQLDLAACFDLLAAGLRSGLSVPDAVLAITGVLPEQPAGALRATADLLALGADPGTAWEPALACEQTAELARAARRAAVSGTALAGVACELATRVRARLAEGAEERSQRAGVLIAGPLGLCFLPAFVCVGVAPVVLGLFGELTTAY
ncbi:type II secretion system F family protein [Haloechinothrix aidingensis]|uniref:type II secretion system F family protein n=1 Tax=Haloechinothrix aidingensis TaxID=2752311 RepID=UPI0031B5E50F